jgi:hypothetical protein
MAHPTARLAAEEINFVRGFYWQMLRRSPKYRRGVADLLRCVRNRRWRLSIAMRSRSRHGSTQQRLELWGKIRKQQDVLDAYEFLLRCYFLVKKRGNAEISGRLHVTGGVQGGDYERLRSAVTALISDCRRRCMKFNRATIRPIGIMARSTARHYPVKALIPGEPGTFVPELQRFSQKWGLTFPMPPSFPEMLEQVFTTDTSFIHPVRILDLGHDLVLDIRLGLPKKLLLAFVDGALHHFVPHTKYWKTLSRKPKGKLPESAKSVVGTRRQKSIQIRLPVRDGRLPYDKATLLRLIGNQIPSPRFSLRPRRKESDEMIQVADYRRLDRIGRGRRLTQRETAMKVFPNTPAIHLVRNREKRFLQFLTILKV